MGESMQEAYKAIADPTRRQILKYLRGGGENGWRAGGIRWDGADGAFSSSDSFKAGRSSEGREAGAISGVFVKYNGISGSDD